MTPMSRGMRPRNSATRSGCMPEPATRTSWLARAASRVGTSGSPTITSTSMRAASLRRLDVPLGRLGRLGPAGHSPPPPPGQMAEPDAQRPHDEHSGDDDQRGRDRGPDDIALRCTGLEHDAEDQVRDHADRDEQAEDADRYQDGGGQGPGRFDEPV